MYSKIKLVAGFVLCFMVSLPAHAEYYKVPGESSHNIEELIISCGAQIMIIGAIEEVGLNSEPLVQLLPPECDLLVSDSAEGLNAPSARGSLPRMVTETKTFRIEYTTFTVTVQMQVYFYRCGEGVCYRVLSIKRRCGGQCWYPLPLVPRFSLPTEIYPEQDGWFCTEIAVQEDPYEEIRTCVKDDIVCSTIDGETECARCETTYGELDCEEGAESVDTPEDLPPLYPGYNEPPAPEAGSFIHAQVEQLHLR
jgi:hypothetical protein